MKMTPTLRGLAVAAALISSFAHAQTDDTDKKQRQDQELCYTAASIANITVLLRNAGRSYDELMERRKKTMAGPQFELAEAITRAIYEKDLKDPITAMGDAHQSCLTSTGSAQGYAEQALRTCPVVGVMVMEVSAARRRGASHDQVVKLLGNRYGDLPQTHGGGVDKLTARYAEGGAPDSGLGDYTACMAAGRK